MEAGAIIQIEKDIDIDDYLNVDYIYISHVHPDHLHIETLKRFPKTMPILIHEYQHKFVYNILNSIGFNNIIQVPHKEEFRLSEDLNIEILAADDCNPEKCGLFIGCKVLIKNTKSLSIDSLAVFKSKNAVLVNTNDCPFELAIDVTKYIKEKYNKIDMLLVGYLGAGPYPQCFENLSTKEKEIAADNKKNHFYSQAISFISALTPNYFMPFAGKYTLAGKLIGLNKWRGNPDMEEVVKELPELLNNNQISSEMIVLDRRNEINILDRGIKINFTPIKTSELIYLY